MLLRVAKGGDMARNFNIGDRVRVNNENIWDHLIGRKGKIIAHGRRETRVLVEFDNKINGGHDGNGFSNVKGKDGHCWWLDSCCLELIRQQADRLIFRDNTTILFKDGKKYVAKCEKGDKYDKEKGLLVCLAKANGYTFKDLQEMLEKAEYQGKATSDEVREVRRRAKKGEWVKIVKENMSFGHYKNGDIRRIINLYINHNGEMPEISIGNGRRIYLEDDEYIVLENYKPNKYK